MNYELGMVSYAVSCIATTHIVPLRLLSDRTD